MIKIEYIGFFTKKQKMHQLLNPGTAILGMGMGGYIKRELFNPVTGEHLPRAEFPTLSLVNYPLEIDFEATEERKNWAVVCRIPGLTFNSLGNFYQLETPDGVLKFPYEMHLTPEHAAELHEEFKLCAARMEQGTLKSRYSAKMIIMRILGELLNAPIEHDAPQAAPLGAEKFKKAIDNDQTFSIPLKVLAESTGYSLEHARILFEKYYHHTPNKYRADRRLERINELLFTTDMNCKEIADAVGMKHLTHLYAFLRRRNQPPPASNCRKK